MITQDQTIITQIQQLVADHHAHDTTGHDHHHITRVFKLSTHLQSLEGGNLFLIQSAALLHDYADFKLTETPEKDLQKLQQILLNFNLDHPTIEQIFHIISQVSFKGAHVNTAPDSLEARIVQDADRIDALGAIGIARTFAYGGAHDSPIHTPDESPTQHTSFEDYKSSRSSTINHFHEKLLLLINRINTPAAKHIAQQRHDFLLTFLKQFHNEWDCNIADK
ncbi:putative hydrolase [Poriferisphaera corsica]|uniref:Putative hydrolase n=1 Tax=Poriferisphaera corsica TaxID=2528020 RepID=A0A517YQ26_9BACT|nr:HD domain-containing protein [Poriferisphaera corsica]QDU32323.1 putative hydrolase [Poriferisphaera corsica]